MTTLREAAQQALEAMEGGADSWQLVGPAIDALKEALVEDAMQKFTDVNQELEAALGCGHCNQPLYAAVKCRVCGRVTEPVKEPAWVCPDSAEHRYEKPGHCEDCGKTLVQVAEPVQEPVAWLWPHQLAELQEWKNEGNIRAWSGRGPKPDGVVPVYTAP